MDRIDHTAPRHREVADYLRDEPLTAVAIAGAVGFVLGGGITRRLGFAMLTTVGRIAVRTVATSLVLGIITGDANYGRPNGRMRATRTGDRDGHHDNGRTDF